LKTLSKINVRYGNRICLMGNFDPVILAFGDLEDADREARRYR